MSRAPFMGTHISDQAMRRLFAEDLKRQQTDRCACQHRRKEHVAYPEGCQHGKCGCPCFVDDL